VKARQVGRAIAKLEAQLGRPPEDTEIADALGVSIETYRDELEALTQVSFIELTEQDRDDGIPLDPNEPGAPLHALERADLLAQVRRGLDGIPERDAILLSLYYVEELTYAEIGKVLDVTESRVCQLHGRAMARLREELSRQGASIPPPAPKRPAAKPRLVSKTRSAP
jgi:RNA polymerase sigma factor for flagellar operon FliA